jgi:hypothetical protein
MKISPLPRNILLLTAALCLVSLGLFGLYARPTIHISPYPDGKNFAFTITDDPDGCRLDKIRPVYSFLDQLGLKTTIACWVFKPTDLTGNPDLREQAESETLENPDYLNFLQEYQRKGFEIALHTVTSGNDRSETTQRGYETFKQDFKTYPAINIMHSKNLENIYWGRNVFQNPVLRFLVGLYDRRGYSGEDPSSIYFWGDICKERSRYIRLWGTTGINTLKFNPSMPYRYQDKPYVNYWFSFSDGYSGRYFTKLLSRQNVDRLVRERGASIVYTHFAAGFCRKTAAGYTLDDTIKNELAYLARQKEGWFVPASTLLDRLSLMKGVRLEKKGFNLEITNQNPEVVYGVTLISQPFLAYRDYTGKLYKANGEGEILLGELKPGQKKTLYIIRDLRVLNQPQTPDFLEQNRLIWQRINIFIFSHRG